MGMCALPVQTEFHAKVGILTLGFSRAHAYKIHLEGFLKYWILKTSPDFLNQNLFLTRVPNESYEEASLAKKKKKVRNDQILKIYSFNDYEQPELTNSGDVDTYTGPTDV